MKCYKILHKPSGLYFKPANGGSNLSKNGKIYTRKPNLSWIDTSIRLHIWPKGKPNKFEEIIQLTFDIEIKRNSQLIDTYVKTNKEDWEIIEIN